MPKKNFDLVYFLVRGLVRNLVFRPFGGIREVDGDNVPMSGALIIAANHVSFADPPVVACSTLRRVNFMAKAELFKPKLFGGLIRRLGAFPVRRGEVDMDSIRHALKLLADGEAILVFPEGGRGDGKSLGEPNRGVVLLAKRSNAAVLPVGISNTDKWLPHGAKMPRRVLLRVAYGKPFTYSEIAACYGDAHAEQKFNEKLMSDIESLIVRS